MKIITLLNILNRNINSYLFLKKLNFKFLLILVSKKEPSFVSGFASQSSNQRAILYSCGCSYGEDVSVTEMGLKRNGLSPNQYEYMYVEKEKERENIYIYIYILRKIYIRYILCMKYGFIHKHTIYNIINNIII